MIPSDYNERQEMLKHDQSRIERFKEKHAHNLETYFSDHHHVREIVQTMTVSVGDVGTDWEAYSPFGMSTGDIIRHNEDCEENERIRQYIYIGIKKKMMPHQLEELEYDMNIMKLENMNSL